MVAAELPEEIVIEILHKLPAKSLLRFRCACKSWDALITGMHLNRGIHDNYQILSSSTSIKILHYQTSSSGECEEVNLDFSNPLNSFTMEHKHVLIGCCNGLLCILFIRPIFLLVLWNPSIREYMMLPAPPLGPNYVYEFAYDSSDYKIVIIDCDPSSLHIGNFQVYALRNFQVYALRTDSRKSIEFGSGFHLSNDKHGTFLNQALNWLVWTKDYDAKATGDNFTNKILRFDLIGDKLSLLPLPYETVSFESNLGVFRGCLCVFANIEQSVHVWIRKEDQQKPPYWCKLFMIPKPSGQSPIGFTKNGQVLMCNQRGSNLILYNIEENRFKELLILERGWQSSNKIEYAETLVSPDVGDKEVQLQRIHTRFVEEFRRFIEDDKLEFSFELETEIFGFKQYVYLFKDDVDELCKECGKPNSAMVILYMKNIYEKMKENGVNCNLAFPEQVEQPNMLAKRLYGRTPVIVPVHISREHWCLVVIVSSVEEERVLWFDSSNIEIERRTDWTKKIEDSINAYRDSTFGGRKKITWQRVRCQKQAQGLESGFYVMLMMRDILTRRKNINFTKEGMESYLTHYATQKSAVDDMYVLKWELLRAYRVIYHHREVSDDSDDDYHHREVSDDSDDDLWWI